MEYEVKGEYDSEVMEYEVKESMTVRSWSTQLNSVKAGYLSTN